MTSKELKTKIKTAVFSRNDVIKLFPAEPRNHINTQLYRLTKRKDLIGIKRGFYTFPNSEIDEYVIANKLYTPSYVSLESVLNTAGVVPDIVSAVTSVTTITSKNLKTPLGTYMYSKINRGLFFGYTSVLDQQSGEYYNIANPEKALLDFIYIRRIRSLIASRVDIAVLDREVLVNYSTHFPVWVRKVLASA